MDWLAQNWIWIALAVGGLFFMTRVGGCGIGNSGGHHRHGASQDHVDGHVHDMRDMSPKAVSSQAATPFDPVSRRGLTAGDGSIASVYHGRAYYFEDRDNRDAFEAEPEKYLANTKVLGEPVGGAHIDAEHPQRRHGC